MDSRTETRVCEKCGCAALVVAEQTRGSSSYNILLHSDLGIVAEHWACQRCPHRFTVSLESPNAATIQLVLGTMFLGLGFLSLAVAALMLLGVLPAASPKASDGPMFIIVFALLVMISPGSIMVFFGYKSHSVLARNPIAHGVAPPPMHERIARLPAARRPRRCSCGGSMPCVRAVQHSFNMIPTGSEFAFECRMCTRVIDTESPGRTLILAFVAAVSLFFANTIYGIPMRDPLLKWILVVVFSLVGVGFALMRVIHVSNLFRFQAIEDTPPDTRSI